MDGKTRFVLLLSGALLWATSAAATVEERETPPKFADFPASPVSAASPLYLDLRSEQARLHRREILAAAKGAPNFAGRYILVTWPCGRACSAGAVIDAKAGQVATLPFTVRHVPELGAQPFEFRADSRLLILRGAIDGGRAGTYYLVWDGRLLDLVAAEQKGEGEPH